ncbi:hypothetical protein ACSQ67_010089 [Phaseolus vulgaris]
MKTCRSKKSHLSQPNHQKPALHLQSIYTSHRNESMYCPRKHQKLSHIEWHCHDLLDSQDITRGTRGLGNSKKHRVLGFDPTCPKRSIDDLMWKSTKKKTTRILCKEERTEDAIRLFRELPAKGFTPSAVSYNILLRSLCYEERWEDANELLAEMDKQGQSHSVVTYNTLITSFSFHGKTEQAFQVLDEMTRSGFQVSATNYNPIVARLCKEGKVDLVVQCINQ